MIILTIILPIMLLVSIGIVILFEKTTNFDEIEND
jgi:hypothetical protein